MNNAPFHVGQKVVALKNSPGTVLGRRIVKGCVYAVHDCFKCKCGQWFVQLKEFWVDVKYFKVCHETGKDPYCGGPYQYFAPIEPRSVSIPASLKEQAEELISVKETIQEPEKEMA